MVPRGDYARVLAEFWADGPSSETPPGHWFSIYNQVSDHPLYVKSWEGKGEVLSDLEYDVRAYFTLGGALHDAAVTAWSVKGYYDYLRPVSAIRGMCDLGQSTDPTLPSYHLGGMPLEPGYIEVVQAGDPLEGDSGEHIGKIKLMTWLGPIVDETADPCLEGDVYVPTVAGVGWKLAEDWWPFQRPSFVSPNFAGYVSGHSTFSRAAAEVLTFMTGDEYFPGGMGEFHCPQNDFLVFEEGPSVDVTLQWATYRDASDQTSLSRIWGGIHPPADDIPGRLMGIKIGNAAFAKAQKYFDSKAPEIVDIITSDAIISDIDDGSSLSITLKYDECMDQSSTPNITFIGDDPTTAALTLTSSDWTGDSTYVMTYSIADTDESFGNVSAMINGTKDRVGNEQLTVTSPLFVLDTENPEISVTNITVSGMPTDQYNFEITFSESMNSAMTPMISFPVEDPLANSLTLSTTESYWSNDSTYIAVYDLTDAEEEIDDIDISISGMTDVVGNQQLMFTNADAFSIDTKDPSVASIVPNQNVLTDAQVGAGMLSVAITFDEEMDQSFVPTLAFPIDDPLTSSLTADMTASGWMNETVYIAIYDLADANEEMTQIDVVMGAAKDLIGNDLSLSTSEDVFLIDTENPTLLSVSPSSEVISDNETGSATFTLTYVFDEDMDESMTPTISYPAENPLLNTLTASSSSWTSPTTFVQVYDVADMEEVLPLIDTEIGAVADHRGNMGQTVLSTDQFSIEMSNPELLILSANTYDVDNAFHGAGGFSILVLYDEAMDTDSDPVITFPVEDPLQNALTFNPSLSSWASNSVFDARYDVADIIESLEDIDVTVDMAEDISGNLQVPINETDFFNINLDSALSVVDIGGLPIADIFPNPAAVGNDITVSFSRPIEQLNLMMIDLSGKIVLRETHPRIDERLTIQTEGFAEGMYFLYMDSPVGRTIFRMSLTR
jgi:hypothetical protein